MALPPNPFQNPGWWTGPNSLLGQFGTAVRGAANTLGTAASGALDTVGTAAGGAFNSLTGPVRQLGADLGGEGVWPQNASPEDTAAIVQALTAAGMDPTIDPQTGQPKDPDAAAILDGIRSGRLSPAAAWSQIEEAKVNRNLEAERGEGMGGLQEIEDIYGGNIQARIDRLAKLTADPLAIRSDPEYGAILRDVEQQGVADVREAGRSSSARAAARGTGFSGKTLDATRAAQESARLGGWQTLGGLHQTAQQSLDAQRESQNQFVTGLEGARANLRSNTRTTPLNFRPDMANQLDLRQANLQRLDAPANAALDFTGKALGTGANLTGNVLGNLPSPFRFGK